MPESYLLLLRLSLVEYFYTQGSLTLVAGEPHEQVCFGPCCMTVVRSNDDKYLCGPWAGHFNCVFCIMLLMPLHYYGL